MSVSQFQVSVNVIGQESIVGYGGFKGSGISHTNLVEPTIVSEDGNVSIVCAGY
jgi:hypothetical protein